MTRPFGRVTIGTLRVTRPLDVPLAVYEVDSAAILLLFPLYEADMLLFFRIFCNMK